MSNKNSISSEGQYIVKHEHQINAVLQQAIDSFESVATIFSIDAIKDASLPQKYILNIKRISNQAISDVSSGKLTVKEGAEFCQEMRNKIMGETRSATSLHSFSYAESLKKDGKILQNLLDKNSKEIFNTKFSKLNLEQKNKVYYSIIESDNKSQEALRQTTIISGGIIGGRISGIAAATGVRQAGISLSPLCGPGAWACAIAAILIGSLIGGMIGESLSHEISNELDEANLWFQ